GWFTNLLAEIPGTEVIGVDVNDLELEQAARVFKKSNLLFVYADIFSPEADALKEFDIITLNSCIQYFDDFKKITDLLQLKLKKGGELHIIDSPFYHQDDIAAARNRTNEYFDQLGYPEMAKNYFHHSWTDVSDFHSLYDPKKSKIKKLFGVADTPFHWLCRKQEVW
ncbi:MAG: class I SAM-dependent methyltransferase, partial [Bacteroidota bacterium]